MKNMFTNFVEMYNALNRMLYFDKSHQIITNFVSVSTFSLMYEAKLL